MKAKFRIYYTTNFGETSEVPSNKTFSEACKDAKKIVGSSKMNIAAAEIGFGVEDIPEGISEDKMYEHTPGCWRYRV